MKILIVDDEKFAVKDLTRVLLEISKTNEIVGYTSPKNAIAYAKENTIDVAFLDIEIGATNGIVLAKQLKDIQPNLHIICVTAHPQYAVDAFKIKATGYLIKPALKKDILRELTFLYGESLEKQHIRVQTFGGLDLFVEETMVEFKRQKTRELFAYLIDKQGSPATTKELCAILWEDEPYTTNQKNYFQQILVALRSTLNEVGIENILIRGRNSLAIDVNKVTCDSYQFLKGDIIAVNKYRGNYLPQYSWAEFKVSKFEHF